MGCVRGKNLEPFVGHMNACNLEMIVMKMSHCRYILLWAKNHPNNIITTTDVGS